MQDRETPQAPGPERRAARTLAELVQHFTELGYQGAFRAEEGVLREVASGRRYRPEQLSVDEIARFEGISDPDDQAMVLALHCGSDGVRGTYTVAFGPGMDPADGEMVRRLQDRRRP